jgi:predicted secreted protein
MLCCVVPSCVVFCFSCLCVVCVCMCVCVFVFYLLVWAPGFELPLLPRVIPM